MKPAVTPGTASADPPDPCEALLERMADAAIERGYTLTTTSSGFVGMLGRTVVYALAKQLNKEWDQRALEVAASPESLSMAADDFTDALQNVRRDIGRKLRTIRVPIEGIGEAAAAVRPS